jgi:hypothetical protein
MILHFLVIVSVCLALPLWSVSAEAIIADHNTVGQFDLIPEEAFDQIRADCNFFYGHTSHGSQIMTGIAMLAGESPALYAQPSFYELGDDLGGTGDLFWVAPTRSYLNSHPECNIVLWSWCGGVSGNTQVGIDAYLNAMTDLELEYPGVAFVYMTGHLDGTGADGNLYARNNQIRDYCAANGKVLFDFADIESYDPYGTWYPDETDACYWCIDWCAVYACPSCGDCAHSHCFNCYLKGKAFWWMMAQVLDWEPEPCCIGLVGDANGSGDEEPTIGDVSFMIDAKFIAQSCEGKISCLAEADINGSAEGAAACDDITIGDISMLIDYLFITGPETFGPLPDCP